MAPQKVSADLFTAQLHTTSSSLLRRRFSNLLPTTGRGSEAWSHGSLLLIRIFDKQASTIAYTWRRNTHHSLIIPLEYYHHGAPLQSNVANLMLRVVFPIRTCDVVAQAIPAPQLHISFSITRHNFNFDAGQRLLSRMNTSTLARWVNIVTVATQDTTKCAPYSSSIRILLGP
jgi:hypothetical protein